MDEELARFVPLMEPTVQLRGNAFEGPELEAFLRGRLFPVGGASLGELRLTEGQRLFYTGLPDDSIWLHEFLQAQRLDGPDCEVKVELWSASEGRFESLGCAPSGGRLDRDQGASLLVALAQSSDAELQHMARWKVASREKVSLAAGKASKVIRGAAAIPYAGPTWCMKTTTEEVFEGQEVNVRCIYLPGSKTHVAIQFAHTDLRHAPTGNPPRIPGMSGEDAIMEPRLREPLTVRLESRLDLSSEERFAMLLTDQDEARDILLLVSAKRP